MSGALHPVRCSGGGEEGGGMDAVVEKPWEVTTGMGGGEKASSCPRTATAMATAAGTAWDEDEGAGAGKLQLQLVVGGGDSALKRAEAAANFTRAEDEDEDEGSAGSAAESVASEADASSNALNGHSQVSDGDSPREKRRDLKRCPSGTSIVTYEAASKLREAGTCERTGTQKPAHRVPPADGPGTSINAGQRMGGSSGPAWTEDKHWSYLNSIEQTFVNSLYGQDYRTGSGQDDQDCVESRPMYGSSPSDGELFTSLQRGCYGEREYYKPHFLHKFAASTSGIFSSPWIQHFKPKTGAGASHGAPNAGQEEADASAHPSNGAAEGESAGANSSKDAKEEVMESPDLPEAGSRRHQSQHFASSSGPVRADNSGIQGKKRPCDTDPNEALYEPKKLKPTQRLQAVMDLDMEEQFVLKQKHLKERAANSPSKGDSRANRVGGCGLDLNQVAVEAYEDEETNASASPSAPQDVSSRPDFITASLGEGAGAKCTEGFATLDEDVKPKTDEPPLQVGKAGESSKASNGTSQGNVGVKGKEPQSFPRRCLNVPQIGSSGTAMGATRRPEAGRIFLGEAMSADVAHARAKQSHGGTERSS